MTSKEPQPPSYDAAVDPNAFPGGPVPYPTYYQPYPSQQQPYPPQQQPYPPQQQPYPAAYLPTQYGAAPPPGQHVPYNSPNVGYREDVELGKSEEGLLGIISFDDKSVRLGFIRKVFAILVLQMAVTVGMTCWFIFHEPTKLFVQNHVGLYAAGYCIFLVLYFLLVCCTNVARKHPINLILLAVFTLSLSYLVAVISSFHNTKIVLILFAMTLLISVGIIGFASQTKYDFTLWGGVLFVCCFALFFFGLFAAVLVPMGSMKILNIVYASLGALLFMAFLAYDTQLIMGGRKYEMSPEDYVFGAMMLYVDIVYIFLCLLSLFGGSN